MERFEAYIKELNVGPEDTVDLSLIKDIIDIEILMLRADNALAISGSFIEEVVAGIDDQGRAVTKPELHKAFEAKSRLRAERTKLLNQLNSTRKDKKQDVYGLADQSIIAAKLMEKMRRLQAEGKIIDVTPNEVATSSEEGETNGTN